MMYSAVIPVHVSLAGGTLRDAMAQVTDQLADIDEYTPAFLDFAVSADATDNTAVFEITADANDDLEAMAGALSWVRAAIHAISATPGWSIAGVGAVEVEALATPAEKWTLSSSTSIPLSSSRAKSSQARPARTDSLTIRIATQP